MNVQHAGQMISSVKKMIIFFAVIECDPLDKPDNGDVIIESTLFQAVATYTCNPGYELVGTAQRICSGEGIWSGVAPICERKELQFSLLP